MSATTTSRRPGLAWVVVLSVIEMIAVAAGAGPPVQPLLSILFALTCPGFLLIDLATPRDPVARVMLGIGGSLAINASLVTIVLVSDIRPVALVLVLALAFLALLPRATLRRVINSIKSLMRRTPSTETPSAQPAEANRLTPVYVDRQAAVEPHETTAAVESEPEPAASDVEPDIPVADHTTENSPAAASEYDSLHIEDEIEAVAPLAGATAEEDEDTTPAAPDTAKDMAQEPTRISQSDFAALLDELRTVDEEPVATADQQESDVDQDTMPEVDGPFEVEDDGFSTSDQGPPVAWDEEPHEDKPTPPVSAADSEIETEEDDARFAENQAVSEPAAAEAEAVGTETDTDRYVAEEEHVSAAPAVDTPEDETVALSDGKDTAELVSADVAAAVNEIAPEFADPDTVEVEDDNSIDDHPVDDTSIDDAPVIVQSETVPSADETADEPAATDLTPPPEAIPSDEDVAQPPPVVIFGVDINRAGPESIAAFPGMQPRPAALIVAYRDRHGPFKEARELLRLLRVIESQQKARGS